MLKSLVPNFYLKMPLDAYTGPFFRNPTRLIYQNKRDIPVEIPHELTLYKTNFSKIFRPSELKCHQCNTLLVRDTLITDKARIFKMKKILEGKFIIIYT